MPTNQYHLTLICLTILVALGRYVNSTQQSKPQLQIIAHKDLPFEKNMNFTKFMGLWYTIASKPTLIQSKCKCAQTVDTLIEDLVVQLSESCLIYGKNITSKSKAVATISGYGNWTNVNGVSKSPYWIVELDSDYEWAIVGQPSRKQFKIIARNYEIPKSLLLVLVTKGVQLGFDLKDLQVQDQSCHQQIQVKLQQGEHAIIKE